MANFRRLMEGKVQAEPFSFSLPACGLGWEGEAPAEPLAVRNLYGRKGQIPRFSGGS